MVILFPNAIDYIGVINTNVVNNALARRSSYLLLPSLYRRAYMLVHETGEVPCNTDIIAPDESIGGATASLVRL